MPINLSGRVEEAEWDKYSDYLEKLWRDALASMKVMSQAFFGQAGLWADYYARNPGVQQNRPDFNPGILAAKIEQAVAVQLTLVPHLHREPTGDSPEASAQASSLEKGLTAVVADAFTRASNFPTVENGKQLFMFNYTQRLTLLNTERLVRPKKEKGESQEDFERREWEWEGSGYHWNPITYVVPTPGEVLMEPFEASPPAMIWRKKLKAFQLAALTQNRLSRKQNDRPGLYKDDSVDLWDMGTVDAYQDMDIEELWTPSWILTRLKGGEIKLRERNRSGIQPALQVWGGNAISKVGEEFNLKNWVEQAMMFRALPTLRMYAQAKYARHEVLMKRATAPYVTAGDTAALAKGLESNVIQAQKDEVWILNTPDLPAQAYQEEQDLVRSLDALTFSPLAAGIREAGAQTAMEVSIRAENTAQGFAAMVTKMAHIESMSGSNTQKLVYRASVELGKDYEEIGIGKNKLRVRDMGPVKDGKVRPQFHIQASFKQVSSVESMQALQRWEILFRNGLVGDAAGYLAADIEDPEGARHDALMFKVRQSPDVQAQMEINALREMKMLELADKKQQELDQRIMLRLAAEAGVPPQGIPAIPGGPSVAPQPAPTNGAGGMP